MKKDRRITPFDTPMSINLSIIDILGKYFGIIFKFYLMNNLFLFNSFFYIG